MALRCALQEARSFFAKHRDETNEETLQGLYADGREAADMLKFNIVQGVQNERGNFGARRDSDPGRYILAPWSGSRCNRGRRVLFYVRVLRQGIRARPLWVARDLCTSAAQTCCERGVSAK